VSVKRIGASGATLNPPLSKKGRPRKSAELFVNNGDVVAVTVEPWLERKWPLSTPKDVHEAWTQMLESAPVRYQVFAIGERRLEGLSFRGHDDLKPALGTLEDSISVPVCYSVDPAAGSNLRVNDAGQLVFIDIETDFLEDEGFYVGGDQPSILPIGADIKRFLEDCVLYDMPYAAMVRAGKRVSEFRGAALEEVAFPRSLDFYVDAARAAGIREFDVPVARQLTRGMTDWLMRYRKDVNCAPDANGWDQMYGAASHLHDALADLQAAADLRVTYRLRGRDLPGE
jgi:hypothetical protein